MIQGQETHTTPIQCTSGLMHTTRQMTDCLDGWSHSHYVCLLMSQRTAIAHADAVECELTDSKKSTECSTIIKCECHGSSNIA